MGWGNNWATFGKPLKIFNHFCKYEVGGGGRGYLFC